MLKIRVNNHEIQENKIRDASENEQTILQKHCYNTNDSIRCANTIVVCIIHHIDKIGLKCYAEWGINEADVGKMWRRFNIRGIREFMMCINKKLELKLER